MHGFAPDDIDSNGVFVIYMIVEGRSAPSDAYFNLERIHFKWKLGADKLDNSSPTLEIQIVSFSRKMCVKVAKHRIKVDFDQRIISSLMCNIFDFNSSLVSGRENRRLTSLRIKEINSGDFSRRKGCLVVY